MKIKEIIIKKITQNLRTGTKLKKIQTEILKKKMNKKYEKFK